MKKCNIMVLILILLSYTAYGEHFRAGTAHWPPYAYYTEDKKAAGIAVEVLNEISNKTGHTFRIRLYPAKRLNMMFKENLLDINFADSPLWNVEMSNPDYVFSISYINIKEYVYFPSRFKPVKPNIEGLSGKTVGIILGYYYPMLEHEFRGGSIHKIEFTDEIELLDNLKKQKIDAAIFDDILFNYLTDKKGYRASDFKRSIQLSNAPLGMKLRIEKKSYLKELNNELERLIKSGKLKSIIKKYSAHSN